MNKLFALPGDISLTSEVVSAIRDGYRRVRDISDPVGSIELVKPVDQTKPSYWALNWFSKQYAPAEMLFRIEDVELALSADAQNELRGKLIDLVDGEIVIRDSFP